MRGVLLFIMMTAFVAGCGGGKGSKNRGGSAQGMQAPPPKPSETDWITEKLELICAPGIECPAQVGLLLFVFPEVPAADGKREYPLRKCTAFLTAPNQITSNGHCDYLGKGQGYFITAGAGGKQVRRISGLVGKTFTPHPLGGERDSGRPDVAVFSLDAPMNLRPVGFATVNDPLYTKLFGYVVNGGGRGLKFSIDRVECDVRRHEATFPFELSENPDVLTIFNCATRRGNSGAPFFAPGSNKVQAINQGAGDPSILAQLVRERYNRDLYNYENRWTVKATNVRCLSAPPGICAIADDNTANHRFNEMQRKAFFARGGRQLEFNEWAEVIN